MSTSNRAAQYLLDMIARSEWIEQDINLLDGTEKEVGLWLTRLFSKFGIYAGRSEASLLSMCMGISLVARPDSEGLRKLCVSLLSADCLGERVRLYLFVKIRRGEWMPNGLPTSQHNWQSWLCWAEPNLFKAPRI